MDRDGTINEENGYVHKITDLHFTSGAQQAIRLAHEGGYLVVVISNQAGVARGYYTEDAVKRFHDHMQAELKKAGTIIDGFYYCPHHPEKGQGKYLTVCKCRKPEPGMLVQASKDLDIDLSRSFMIGDHLNDIWAGHNAGCRTLLVRTGYGKDQEMKLGELDFKIDMVTDTLLDAVRAILGRKVG